MRPKRLEQTRQKSLILPVKLISLIDQEAKHRNLYPATVVERRLAHSYSVSPELPTLPDLPR